MSILCSKWSSLDLESMDRIQLIELVEELIKKNRRLQKEIDSLLEVTLPELNN